MSEKRDRLGYIKRKKNYAPYYSPQFWDRLSVIALTRHSILELDRRIATLPGAPTNSFTASPKPQVPETDVPRVARLAEDGGPNLSGLRGVDIMIRSVQMRAIVDASQRSAMRTADKAKGAKPCNESASESESESNSLRSRTLTPHEREYAQALHDNGIFADFYISNDVLHPEPRNIEQLRAMLEEHESSTSTVDMTDDDVQKFRLLNALSSTKNSVVANVLATIRDPEEHQYAHSMGVKLQVKPLVDGFQHQSRISITAHLLRRSINVFSTISATSSSAILTTAYQSHPTSLSKSRVQMEMSETPCGAVFTTALWAPERCSNSRNTRSSPKYMTTTRTP